VREKEEGRVRGRVRERKMGREIEKQIEGETERRDRGVRDRESKRDED